MAKLLWDQVGSRLFETGVDRGVLYPVNNLGVYETGVAWNGLTSVSENPSGGEATKLWADNINYLTLYSAEEFAATIEAFYYPEAFALCDGSAKPNANLQITGQARKAFGLSWRTRLGNDVLGSAYSYKIHVLYGGVASPSSKQAQTINDSPEASTFSWEVTTTPIVVAGYEPTAHIVIDVTGMTPAKLKTLEDKLYGEGATSATLPLPAELIALTAP